ncbi:MurR/RpiR family transcriptional regulator [Vibrio sp.]|nr:MurR/RpiR family transcriptional regulator [Vibrio sp.]
MTNNSSLSSRITKHYSSLTDGNRRIADFLQVNPEKLLMMSTSEIAETCHVSKTSVSRFIRKLGYEDHVALRNELMSERDKGNPVITSELHDSGFSQDVIALEKLWSQLAEGQGDKVVEKLITAKRVKIIGYRNSYPLAMHFRQQLAQCRENVELLPLPGQTIGEDLSLINDDDFVILFGIRRRVANFQQIVEFLKPYDCLLITDQSGQKYASDVKQVFVCYMNNDLPLDSYSVPMSLVSYFVNQTFFHLKERASNISSTISSNYRQLGELE